ASCSLLAPPPASALFPYTTPSDLARVGDADLSDQGLGQILGEDARVLGPTSRVEGERVEKQYLRGFRQIGAKRARRDEAFAPLRSEEHTSELQSLTNLVCRLLLET